MIIKKIQRKKNERRRRRGIKKRRKGDIEEEGFKRKKEQKKETAIEKRGKYIEHEEEKIKGARDRNEERRSYAKDDDNVHEEE